MSCRIVVTPSFEKAFKRLKKRYRSLPEDFILFVSSLKENPLQGVDLGRGLYKTRLAISSKGKGKRGGARVITYNVIQHQDFLEVFLLDIYDKSEQETLSDKELKALLQEMESFLS